MTQQIASVTTPQVNVQSLLQEDLIEEQLGLPYRFGYRHEVNYSLNNSGTWEFLPDGSKIWRLMIICPDAKSINLTYSEYWLPERAELFIYNPRRNIVFGAFTSSNNKEDGLFATGIIPDDTVIVEYFEPSNVISSGRITIDGVIHVYKGVLGYGDSGPCNINVNCPQGEPWQKEKRSVAMIVTHGGTRLCTGSMLNNVQQDRKPYFLTANHCLTGQSNQWVFIFNYESPTCTNQDGPLHHTLSGSTLKAANSATDFALLYINEAPPDSYRVDYNGWDATGTIPNSGAGIHHPRGDIKKISLSSQTFISSSYMGSGSQPYTHWWVKWKADGTSGVTEPGSSGSPIFDQNKRVVGQLHGGLSSCTALDKSDYYGKFSLSWNYGTTSATRLKDWLDPNNTGTLVLNGLGNLLTLDQQRQDGTRLSYTTVGRWNGSSFTEITIPAPPNSLPTFSTTIGAREILRGSQEMVSNPTEKYRVWRRGTEDQLDTVQNHRGFTIRVDDANFTSRFLPTHTGITLKNNLESSPVNGGDIQFKDPWLIDYPDPLYGNNKRNRGMKETGADALIFKPRTSPFYPDYNTNYNGDVHKGVFLDQGGTGFTPPFYSVKALPTYDIYLSHTGRTHKFYFQNWTGSNVNYQYPNNLESGVVFTNSNAVASAYYKGTQLTEDISAFRNHNQRRFIRTPDGYLHIVYESGGKIYYETKHESEEQWTLINNGQAIGQGKEPSIDYCSYSYIPETIGVIIVCEVFIVFAQEGFNSQIIKLQRYRYNPDMESSYTLQQSIDAASVNQPYVNTCNAQVVFHSNNKISLVWKKSFGGDDVLRLGRGSFSIENGIIMDGLSTGLPIANTSGAVNHTVAASKTGDTPLHLAWEFRPGRLPSIIYYDKIINPDASSINVVPQNLSQYNGCADNSKPSIIAVVDANNQSTARIAWIAERIGDPTGVQLTEAAVKTAVLKDPASPLFWYFGNDVKSVNINKSSTRWTLGWGRSNDLPLQFIDSRSLSYKDIYSLGINGKDVQISNGVNNTDMFALAFNSGIPPYVINTKQLYQQSMPQEILATSKSREGIVAKADAQIYYSIGNIEVDGEKIDFKEIPDEAAINTLQQTNNYLMSKPFQVEDNSEFYYTIKFGVTDPEAVEQALTNNEYVNFKVELIDANTNELLGVFDEVTYNQQNVAQYNNVAYQINTNGLGSRTVKLRLVITNNIDPYYSISEKLEEAPNAMLKKHYTQTSYKGSLAEKVYTYNLDQNYPNPFNPSTVISYQVASAGHVSLKIYDLLGREVTTLINEEKPSGSYTVNFEASKLSTGVYFYELKSGNYRAVKKLMLMK